MLKIGDIRIHLINDCITMVDGGGPFGLVPRKLWERVIPHDGENMVPMHQTCLLAQVGERNIVVDTGMGNKLSEKELQMWQLRHVNGGLIDGLARLGLTSADIDLVINTHLHADHVGGSTTFAPDGRIVPTFLNAEHVVQRREYEDAMHPNERTRATYIAANFQALMDTGQLRVLDGDTELAPGVWGVVTPGHTPGHMSVRFESGGQHAAFVCDMASYAVHFEKLAWMTAYDVEPLVTLETKRQWQKWALETNALIIFPHDPKRVVGRLVIPENGAPRIEAVEEPYV